MNLLRPVLKLPSEIESICRRIAAAGEKVYVVGGAVRDAFLGKTGYDVDLATTADPSRISQLFQRVIPTGIAHGTVTVLVGGQKAEVTTLREEGPYRDGRRPSSVAFHRDIGMDLARRDFTINAMAWDPIAEELHDPFGGRGDLEAKQLRAVGNPADRFAEDRLRLLRAARFAARLEFDVAEETLRAMPGAAPGLRQVSAERKRDELLKLLAADVPSRGLAVAEKGGLLPYLSEDLAQLVGAKSPALPADRDLWRHTLDRVDAVQNLPQLRLAALLCDIGKATPGTKERPSSPKGDGRSQHLVLTWLREWRLDKKTIDRVLRLVSASDFAYLSTWTDAQLRRWIRDIGIDATDDQLALKKAEYMTQACPSPSLAALDELSGRIERLKARGLNITLRDLAVDGKELIDALGLLPGPALGMLLEALLEHIIDCPEDNAKERLIAIARRLHL